MVQKVEALSVCLGQAGEIPGAVDQRGIGLAGEGLALEEEQRFGIGGQGAHGVAQLHERIGRDPHAALQVAEPGQVQRIAKAGTHGTFMLGDIEEHHAPAPIPWTRPAFGGENATASEGLAHLGQANDPRIGRCGQGDDAAGGEAAEFAGQRLVVVSAAGEVGDSRPGECRCRIAEGFGKALEEDEGLVAQRLWHAKRIQRRPNKSTVVGLFGRGKFWADRWQQSARMGRRDSGPGRAVPWAGAGGMLSRPCGARRRA